MMLAKVKLAKKKYSNRETPLNLKTECIVCERGKYKTYRKVGKWTRKKKVKSEEATGKQLFITFIGRGAGVGQPRDACNAV